VRKKNPNQNKKCDARHKTTITLARWEKSDATGRQQKKLAPGQVTNSAANREVQTDAKISERTKQEK
jgi:hypothetical protein